MDELASTVFAPIEVPLRNNWRDRTNFFFFGKVFVDVNHSQCKIETF